MSTDKTPTDLSSETEKTVIPQLKGKKAAKTNGGMHVVPPDAEVANLPPGGEKVAEPTAISDAPAAPKLGIVKPSFMSKFKSKNVPTMGAVETVLSALKVFKVGEIGDFSRAHHSEDDYWTDELCFVSVPIKGARPMVHLIDDDIAVKYLPSKKVERYRLALACNPEGGLFFIKVPSRNLDNEFNADAIKAVYQMQTHWAQANSRRSEGLDGYTIEFSTHPDPFPGFPKWEELKRSLDELLEVTFRAANIDHDHHPGLLRLIGSRQDLT